MAHPSSDTASAQSPRPSAAQPRRHTKSQRRAKFTANQILPQNWTSAHVAFLRLRVTACRRTPPAPIAIDEFLSKDRTDALFAAAEAQGIFTCLQAKERADCTLGRIRGKVGDTLGASPACYLASAILWVLRPTAMRGLLRRPDDQLVIRHGKVRAYWMPYALVDVDEQPVIAVVDRPRTLTNWYMECGALVSLAQMWFDRFPDSPRTQFAVISVKDRIGGATKDTCIAIVRMRMERCGEEGILGARIETGEWLPAYRPEDRGLMIAEIESVVQEVCRQ